MLNDLKELFLENYCQILLVCVVSAAAILASG